LSRGFGTAGRELLIPVIGLVFIIAFGLVIFVPLPVVYLYLRFGRVYGLSAAGLGLVVVLASAALSGGMQLTMLIVPLTLVAYSALIGEFAWRTRSFVGTLFFALITLCITLLLSGGYFLFFSEASLEQLVRDQLHMLTTNEHLFQDETHRQQFLSSVTELAPSLLLVNAFVLSWLNLVILFRRFPGLFLPSDLSKWQLPENLIWIVAAALGIFTLGFLVNSPWVDRVGMNLLVGVGMLYFFQGLSITAFYLTKLKTFALLKPVLYVLAFVQFNVVLALLGVFDVWFDFRGLHRQS